MYRRQPSTESHSSSTSSVRRCSGQARPFSLKPSTDEAPEDKSFEVSDHNPDAYKENLDNIPVRRYPTVVLVKSNRRPSQRFVSGPLLPTFNALTSRSPTRSVTHVVVTTNSASPGLPTVGYSEATPTHESVISLALSARPSDVELSSPQESAHCCSPSLSQSSPPTSDRLPSPASSNSTILSTQFSSTGPLEPNITRPHTEAEAGLMDVSRSPSNDSEYSLISTVTAVSMGPQPAIDSGRTSSILALKTTDRFTHRWPKPKALRVVPVADGISISLPKSPSQTNIALLGADKGLEVQIVTSDTKWTSHKWCLLASVISVFGCGLVCLACAVFTWIEGHPSQSFASLALLILHF